MLNKMKIRTKLLLSFIIVGILLGLIGVYSTNRMKFIQKEDKELYETNLVPLGNCTNIVNCCQEIRVKVLEMILSEDSADVHEKFNDMKKLEKTLDSAMIYYSMTKITKENRRNYEELEAAINNTFSYIPDIKRLLDNHDQKGAYKIITQEMISSISALQRSVDSLIDFNVIEGKNRADYNETRAKISVNAIIMTVLAGIIILLVLGILISNNVQGILCSVISQIKELTDAAINGKLKFRADPEKTNKEFRDIVVEMNKVLDSIISPLNVTTEYVMKISKGEIPKKIMDNYNGDFNDLKNNLNKCLDGLNGLVEVNCVLQKMSVNDYSEKVLGQYEGIFAEVASATNTVQERLLHVITIVQNIAKGDLGDYSDLKTIQKRSENDILIPSMSIMIDAIHNLIEDTLMLSEAAVQGNLSVRADLEKHTGSYRQIVEGINKTLDALIGPMNVALKYVQSISNGDNPKLITETYYGDFNAIKDNLNMLIKANNEIIEKAKLVAGGDLTVDLKKRSDNDELMQSITDMVKSTGKIIAEFKSASNNISASSEQMSSTSQEMSQGASEQASSAEEMSSSMEEMAANIQQNTENAQQTEKIAINAAEAIQNVAAAAQATLKNIREIADKVSIIGEIARQTNILALNAAVEAARAGEHGKGFAVVASEVRKLAERSQVSAVEIDQLTKNSVRITEDSGKLMEAIVPEIGKTSKLVQEIAAASIEQNSGADQVNNAVQQLNQVTQQNAAAAEEMATSSEELASQAQQLLEMISFFKLNNEGTGIKGKIVNMKQEHSASLENSVVKHSNKIKAKEKGATIDMGKDSLDSNYEKF
jgi:methyl-accepting chemotaxis protein